MPPRKDSGCTLTVALGAHAAPRTKGPVCVPIGTIARRLSAVCLAGGRPRLAKPPVSAPSRPGRGGAGGVAPDRALRGASPGVTGRRLDAATRARLGATSAGTRRACPAGGTRSLKLLRARPWSACGRACRLQSQRVAEAMGRPRLAAPTSARTDRRTALGPWTRAAILCRRRPTGSGGGGPRLPPWRAPPHLRSAPGHGGGWSRSRRGPLASSVAVGRVRGRRRSFRRTGGRCVQGRGIRDGVRQPLRQGRAVHVATGVDGLAEAHQ